MSFFKDLRRALAAPLPGPAAQYKLAPDGRAGPEVSQSPPADARYAAVLILLYDSQQAQFRTPYRSHNDPGFARLRFPMIRRPQESGPHSGQIAFPGGAREEQDADLAETALRETREEIGVPEESIELLGALTQLYVPPSGFLVQPYVGRATAPLSFVPDPHEVAEVLEIDLAQLMQRDTLREEERPLRGRNVRVPYYRIGEDKIWGASAMMLAEFLELVEGI